MRNSLLSVLAGALTLSSAQAPAQDAETIADVRCIIVGMKFAGTADPTQQSAGMMLSLYYIGRLDGRVPKLDIEELMIKEISTMTTSDYGSEAKRCGASLTDKGQEITRIGKDMIQTRAEDVGYADQMTASHTRLLWGLRGSMLSNNRWRGP
jgi:hypothetical protein